jgi:hypothetical protein
VQRAVGRAGVAGNAAQASVAWLVLVRALEEKEAGSAPRLASLKEHAALRLLACASALCQCLTARRGQPPRWPSRGRALPTARRRSDAGGPRPGLRAGRPAQRERRWALRLARRKPDSEPADSEPVGPGPGPTWAGSVDAAWELELRVATATGTWQLPLAVAVSLT